jgi:hypothetical protein
MHEVVSLAESDSDIDSAEQDGTRFRASEELPVPLQGCEGEWKQAKGYSAKFMMAKYFRGEIFSIPEGEPCISGEQLAMQCPNWYRGRLANVASLAVTEHCQVTLGALAVHKALMEHCTGKWGQYNSTDITYICAQAIKQVAGNLDAGVAEPALHSASSTPPARPLNRKFSDLLFFG